MSSRNPDRREDGRRHIATRLSGRGVPDMPELLVPPPSPPPPPPARPTGEVESAMGMMGLGTSHLQDQQEQLVRQQQQVQLVQQQQVPGQPPPETHPIARAIERLYEKSEEFKGENEELKGQIDVLVDSVKQLNGFVRAVLDLMSDEEHSVDFMRNHLDRFFELLKDNGLSTEKEEKKKGDTQEGDNIRRDIANRLNNIQ